MNYKISAIKNFPQPKNVEKVRFFLGLCSYHRPFIRGFARTASPLTLLLRKEVPYLWNTPQDRSFNDLKSALINAVVLAFPDYRIPFSLYIDASALSLGTVMMQPDARGKNRAIAYASHTLNEAEANCSVTHQEALAIVWALKHLGILS